MRRERVAIVLAAILVLGSGLWVPATLDGSVAWAATPCCGITSIQPNGLVTAQERGGAGRPFQFSVSDPALFRSLRVGQAIQADFTTMRVSIRLDRLEPCCNVVSLAGKAITPAPLRPTVRP